MASYNVDEYQVDRFYVSTFSYEMNTVWEYVGFDIADLCYRAMFTAFSDDSESLVLDRQNLLYDLLRGPFPVKKPDDPLRLLRKFLPTRNWIPKVTENICVAYNDFPIRVFSNDVIINKVMTRYYNDARAYQKIRSAYSLATLHNYVLVRPYFNFKDKLRLQVLLPDMFRIRWNPDDTEQIQELWIAERRVVGDEDKRKEKIVFQVWTDSTVEYRDVYGDRVGQSVENEYGVIPFVPLQMKESLFTSNPMGGGLYSLVNANLIDNALNWFGMNSVLYNSFDVWVSTNMKWGDRAGLHPGKLVAVEGAKGPSEFDSTLPPSLDAVGADGQYTMLNEYRQSFKEDELFDIGLPDFVASRRANMPTTATEQIFKHASLLQRRKFDIPVLWDFEIALAEMTAIVARVDMGELGLPDSFDEFSIDFPDFRVIQDSAIEIKYDAQLVIAGLMKVETFVQKYSGNESVMEEDEAIQWIKDRQEKLTPVIPFLQSLLTPLSSKPSEVSNA